MKINNGTSLRNICLVTAFTLLLPLTGCASRQTTGSNAAQSEASSLPSSSSVSVSSSAAPSDSVSSSSDSAPNGQAKPAFKSDEYFLDAITDFDLCLGGENDFVFSKVQDIKPDELIQYFQVTYPSFDSSLNPGGSSEQYDFESMQSKTDNKYHIPAAAFERVVTAHLDIMADTIRRCSAYDKTKNEYVLTSLGGFGGNRESEIVKKENLGGNTVRYDIGFYSDESHSELTYHKIATIDIGGDSYRYLSIVKENGNS